ncbi:hypothetical protein [Vitreimonas sp.]|jgi:hypothetical protein|uniref:hypothetical protein n=1 Tax=Vitreimonas sp. TaxID=3069702 RepID=UPI002EDA8368
MEREKTSLAAKRYSRDMLIAGALYAGVVIGGALTLNQEPPQWAVVVIALLPMLPALLMLRAYLVFLKGMDEFQRQIQSEAVAIAAGVTGFGSFSYGFLEEWAGFPHLPLIWVLPTLIFSWGVALCIVRLRYK